MEGISFFIFWLPLPYHNLSGYQTNYLNLSTYNYCLGQVKRYKMEQHSLADCLLQLKGKLQQEGNSLQTLLILDRIDSRLHQHLDSHQRLQKSLSEKETQLKQINRRFKKTSSKLNRRSQECLALKEELTRINGIYTHKIGQLTNQATVYPCKEERREVSSIKNLRKNKTRQDGSQCQILNSETFEELAAQNQKLKVRIEETQNILISEKKQRQDLALEFQRFKEIYESAEPTDSQLIKDNSTDDAGSSKGDPFYFEEDVEMQVEKKQDQFSLREENFLSQIWEYGQKMYRKLSLRN